MHAGFIRHLPRHSSLCVSAIIHAKHFIFVPIIRINGHIHYSHVVVSARRSYQGYKAKHGLPSMYQTQTKMKLNDFIFYPFVKKTFLFCLQNITKKKRLLSPHICSLSSSSLWFFHEVWCDREASTAPTFSSHVSTASAERLRRIQAKWDGCSQDPLRILLLKGWPLSSCYLSFSIYSSIISSSTVFPLVSTYLSCTPRVLVG